MARLAQITPLVSVSDLNRSVKFFVDTLGFQVGFQADGYAYLTRDCAAIRLLQAGEGIDLRDPKRQQSCYIDVEGVDELYQELKPKLDKLPKGRVKSPFDQAYRQREFHVLDEDALLIFFGEPIQQ
jgi:catechol 2,3-dioxygenase-like lactoylglutathione lyase family enzyme